MSTVHRAAVVLASVSAFALTACGPADGGAAGGSAKPPTTSASESATPSGPSKPTAPSKPSAAPAGSTTGGSAGGSSGGASGGSSGGAAGGSSAGSSGSGGGSPADFDVFPCSTYDVTFTASLAEPTTSSYLLKITNKGTKACRALGHPIVTFGDLDGAATERGTAPGIEDALRLEPGESAYAGLMGGADDGKGRTVGSIAMTMNTESDLEQKALKASTPGLYVSPHTNSVTPWVNNAEDALSL